ncbi:MAG: hypothetical protein U0R71_12065 [Solirubrobacterales bacterium]
MPVGYGVEIAMLIDALRIAGLGALAEVDLGSRQNSHQPLRALSRMAAEVMVAVERRSGAPPRPDSPPLRPRPDEGLEGHHSGCAARNGRRWPPPRPPRAGGEPGARPCSAQPASSCLPCSAPCDPFAHPTTASRFLMDAGRP